MRAASKFHHLSSGFSSNKEKKEKIAGQARYCKVNREINRFSRESFTWYFLQRRCWKAKVYGQELQKEKAFGSVKRCWRCTATESRKSWTLRIFGGQAQQHISSTWVQAQISSKSNTTRGARQEEEQHPGLVSLLLFTGTPTPVRKGWTRSCTGFSLH